MITLKLSLRFCVALYLIGFGIFWYFKGLESGLWFGLGGGLSLLNVFLAAFSVRYGFENIKKSSIFVGFMLMKSLTFILVVATVLIFLKPQLLPFTLGISVVIVGATLLAFWELRKLKRSPKPEDEHLRLNTLN